MKRSSQLLLLVAVAGFVLGLAHLFRLRFESGDAYPRYSSLRTDPLGTKGLYDSLSTLLPVARNVRNLARLGDGQGTTLLILAVDHRDLEVPPSEFKALETFVRSGGRLVISFDPSYGPEHSSGFPLGSRAGATRWRGTNAPSARPGGGGSQEGPLVALETQWAWTFFHLPLERGTNGVHLPAPARRRDTGMPGPLELPQHTALVMRPEDPAWQVLYARDCPTNTAATILERRLGRGSLVLVADSWPFSNEALRRDRQSSLLSWVTGPASRVLFEETHLGTQVEPGIAGLAREYRLGGFFAAALVLAGLFVWRNSSSFLPPLPDPAAGAPSLIPGRDSSAGFINLLRRSIAPVDLMTVCLQQWKEHGAGVRRPSPARLQAMQELIDAENALEPRRRNPLRLYRAFCRVLSPSRPSPEPPAPSSSPP